MASVKAGTLNTLYRLFGILRNPSRNFAGLFAIRDFAESSLPQFPFLGTATSEIVRSFTESSTSKVVIFSTTVQDRLYERNPLSRKGD